MKEERKEEGEWEKGGGSKKERKREGKKWEGEGTPSEVAEAEGGGGGGAGGGGGGKGEEESFISFWLLNFDTDSRILRYLNFCSFCSGMSNLCCCFDFLKKVKHICLEWNPTKLCFSLFASQLAYHVFLWSFPSVFVNLWNQWLAISSSLVFFPIKQMKFYSVMSKSSENKVKCMLCLCKMYV